MSKYPSKTMHPASTPGSGTPTNTPRSGIDGAEGVGIGVTGVFGGSLLGGCGEAGGVGVGLGVEVGVTGSDVGVTDGDVGDAIVGSGDAEARPSPLASSDPPHADMTTATASAMTATRTMFMLMRRTRQRCRSAYKDTVCERYSQT